MTDIGQRRVSLMPWILVVALTIQNGGRSGMQASADDQLACNRSVIDTESEITLAVGDDLTLSCLTENDGDDEQLTWYRDDVALDVNTITTDSDRYMISTNRDDLCSAKQITISNVQEIDGGTYVCYGSKSDSATIYVTVCPILPECSWRLTSENATGLDDTVELTCKTCQIVLENASTNLLSWIKYDRMEIEELGNSSSTLASAVIDIHTAIASQFTCILNQTIEVDEFQTREYASCEVELVTITPEFQTVQEGGNLSFTCHVDLTGYYVSWFLSVTVSNYVSSSTVYSSNKQTGTITLFGVKARPSSSGYSLICLVINDLSGNEVEQKYAYFEVTSNEVTNADTVSTVSTATPGRMTIVYVQTRAPDPSSTLSLTYIIVIAVCGAVVLIVFVVVIACVVYRRHHRHKDPDINTDVASHGNAASSPTELMHHPVHQNVYTSHEIGMEPSNSSNASSPDDAPSEFVSTCDGHHVQETSFEGAAAKEPTSEADLNGFVDNELYSPSDFQ